MGTNLFMMNLFVHLGSLDEQQYSDSIITKIDKDELIIKKTICSSFYVYCTNSSFNSIINEHKYANNNFMCSDTSIEQVG